MTVWRSTLKWGYLGLVLPGILALSAWQGYQWWHWAVSPLAMPTLPEGENTTPLSPKSQSSIVLQVEVPPSTSTRQIGEDLAAMGLIRSTWAWNIWASYLALQDRQGSFKAGTYQLSPDADMKAIAQTIWTGEVMAVQFTIPEGWSLAQMGAYFERRGFFSQAAFMAAAENVSQQQFKWLPQGLETVEGFLYPDTYQLADTTVTPEFVIQMMLRRFETVVLPPWREAVGQNLTTRVPEVKTLLDWVTLASIVEKEAVVDTERTLIAGVFVKRLSREIKLESDPTVEYAFGITQTPEQPLTWEQVRQPSPYNTYFTPGLPPGPIASPGLASLRAVLNPQQTDYLYFVARYDGTHIFSRTLAEHEAAKTQVQKQPQNVAQ